jgi:hypothetical protein
MSHWHLAALVIFEAGALPLEPHLEIESCFMPGLTWTTILLFVLPHIVVMTGTHHHAQQFAEIGSCKLFFASTSLEPQSS